MRFLLDMNLPPRWVSALAAAGHEAVHWSAIGAATASGVELLAWARAHGYVVFTHDLDLGTLLALGSRASPSVVQVRAAARLPETIGEYVMLAIRQHAAALASSALATVEPARSRVRMLPLHDEHTA